MCFCLELKMVMLQNALKNQQQYMEISSFSTFTFHDYGSEM